MSIKKKFYVVWEGRKKGVFDNWDECKLSVDKFNGAKYKSFSSKEEAKEAFLGDFNTFITPQKKIDYTDLFGVEKPVLESISVDSSLNSKTNEMEYKGVLTINKKIIFENGPFFDATNNIGEFLAIIHALSLLKLNKKIFFSNIQNEKIIIYSDSITAISWIKNKKILTTLSETKLNKNLFELIQRGIKWLETNEYTNPILKWETKIWGENPADYGRK